MHRYNVQERPQFWPMHVFLVAVVKFDKKHPATDIFVSRAK
jgi:hypothetical protein